MKLMKKVTKKIWHKKEIKDCEDRGIQPDRTNAIYAIKHGESLNADVEEAIEHMVG